MQSLHILPGRLRVRSEALKRNPKKASEILTALGMLPGVTNVEVSLTTGSVLVHHDPLRISAHDLFAALAECGVRPQEPRPAPQVAQQRGIGAQLAKVVVSSIVQHALERAVVQVLPTLL